MKTIVSVRFKPTGKSYYFDPGGLDMSTGDYVIVDTPAASSGSDARVIAAACGAAVVVARRDASRTDDMKKLIASVKKSSVTIVGVAVNEF